MGNRIWDGQSRTSVHAHGGLKTVGDYSGLYRAENEAAKTTAWKSGDSAIEHEKETARRALNEGDDFAGYTEECEFGGNKFMVGTHPRLGVSAYPQIPASHRANKIEIRYGDGSRWELMKRSEFFGELLSDAPSEPDVALLFEGLRRSLGGPAVSSPRVFRDLTRVRAT